MKVLEQMTPWFLQILDLTIDTSAANANVTLPNIDGTAGDGDDQTDFTVDAGSGTVDVQSIDTDINDVIITGSTITLNGDITTAAGTGGGADAASIDLNGAVVIKQEASHRLPVTVLLTLFNS